MAKQHLENLNAIIAPTISGRFESAKFECKHFFSGAALYANDKICITLTPVGLALKVPKTLRNTLLKKGAKKLRYFPKAPIKKDYIVLPKSILNNTRTLRRWIRASINYVLEGE